MWQKHKVWIVVAGLFMLVVAGGFIENAANNSPNMNEAKSQTAASPVVASAAPQQMQIQNGTVVASGSNYKLLPINELTGSGSFATEGKITQVIPNAITKAHTPYYFIIQNNGDTAVIGVIVPAGNEQNFDPNIFPIGTNVLVAGAIFPFSNQAGVFNYSTLVQATDIVPVIRQLNLPPNTPVITTNFQDMEIIH